MITRVLLVIALLGCLALAQYGSKGNCLCRRTRAGFGDPRAIQDVQIYPPSHSCRASILPGVIRVFVFPRR